MLVERDTIISHFRHIHLGGAMKEVTFTSDLKCAAINLSETILLSAEGLPGVDPLPEPVGVTELAMVLRGLERLTPHESQVVIDFDPASHQFSFRTENDGRVCFVTSPPRLTSTYIDAGFVDAFVSKMSEGDRAPLTLTFSELVRNAAAIIRSDVITLAVRDNGTRVRVGTPERGDFCEFLFPQLRSSDAYELHLAAYDLLPVLRQTQDFTRAELLANGPEGLFGIQEGRYTYILSALADDGQHCVDLVPEPLAEEGSGS